MKKNHPPVAADPASARLLNAHDAAQFLGLTGNTNHTLRRYERDGRIKAIRLSARTVRYSLADLTAFIEAARERKVAA